MACVSKAENAGSEKKSPLDPEEKPYSWFLSQDGQKAYQQTMTIQNFKLDEVYEKEQKEKDIEYFEVLVHVYHKGFQSPRIYLRSLVSALGEVQGCSDALQYTFPIDATAGVLGIIAKPFYSDDNGDPVACDPTLNSRDMCDADKNPILKFVRDFHVYNFANDDMEWKEMVGLWHEALFFVLDQVIDEKMDVLEKNPWLFEKDSYFNTVGGLRTVKSFLANAADVSSDPEYFKKELAKVDD